MSSPLVSVVTPTWQRHDLLLSRCIPSVQAQDYANVEHVIVSDGPDPELAAKIAAADCETATTMLRYSELSAHYPGENFGHFARREAIARASGDYITYNDDDDALTPDHCRLLAAALDAAPEAGFAVSRMRSHGPDGAVTVIGWGPLSCGNVGTPMIMHRRWVLDRGNWGPPSRTEDWDVVWKWLQAGVGYVNVDAETSDVWPSLFRVLGASA